VKLNNKAMFLNLPLFNEVLELHRKSFLIHDIDIIVACGCKKSVCELNPLGLGYVCTNCRKVATKFSDYVDATIYFVEFDNVKNTSEIDYYSIASNYTLSLYRAESINEKETVKRYKSRLGEYCAKLETSLAEFIDELEIDSLYFFNSRFPSGQSAKNSCKIKKINYITYDRFALTRIVFSKNQSVLNPENLSKGVNKELYDLKRDELLKFGDTYLSAKLANKFVAYDVFTDRQKVNLSPEGLLERYVCFFTSSEDEMKYFGLDLDFPVIDQFEFITEFSLTISSSIQIVVRVHPNQEFSLLEKKLLIKFKDLKNIVIVPGSSPVSTYKLMRKSRLNISFGSSTAIESTLMKVPTVLVGRSIYDRVLDVTQINMVIDLVEIIDNQLNFQSITDDQYLLACKWSAYISSNFALEEYRLERKSFSFLHLSLSDKLALISIRLLRALSYPGTFLVDRVCLKYKLFIRQLKANLNTDSG
jgi:hypothetical protein